MPTRRFILLSGATYLAGGAGLLSVFTKTTQPVHAESGDFPVSFDDEEWRKRLTSSQYAILRQHGTERPFSSILNHENRRGVFVCAGCESALFSSVAKYDSRTGWPSFWMPITKEAVGESRDTSYGMVRTEIHCARCGGHLGHVFNDGPPPTGLHYCMNGAAMLFKSADS